MNREIHLYRIGLILGLFLVAFSAGYGQVTLTIPDVEGDEGATILVPVFLELPVESGYESVELSFSGYQPGLSFHGIDTIDCTIGGRNWIFESYVQDGTLFTAFAGTDPLEQSGHFVNLLFQIGGEACTSVPLEFNSGVLDADVSIIGNDALIHIQPVPFFGDANEDGTVNTADFYQILDIIQCGGEYSCQSFVNADVTQDGIVSSLDAYLILNHPNDLPPDTSVNAFGASGSFSHSGYTTISENELELPIQLTDQDNILSFLVTISYDTAFLTFNPANTEWPIEWSGLFYLEYLECTPGIVTYMGVRMAGGNIPEVFSSLRFMHTDPDHVGDANISIDISINEEILPSELSIPIVSVEQSHVIPDNCRLNPAFPNPFNAATLIQFELPQAMTIQLSVYATTGQLVNTLVSGYHLEGQHTAKWSGEDGVGIPVPSGVYLLSFSADNFTTSRKVVLLK